MPIERVKEGKFAGAFRVRRAESPWGQLPTIEELEVVSWFSAIDGAAMIFTEQLAEDEQELLELEALMQRDLEFGSYVWKWGRPHYSEAEDRSILSEMQLTFAPDTETRTFDLGILGQTFTVGTDSQTLTDRIGSSSQFVAKYPLVDHPIITLRAVSNVLNRGLPKTWNTLLKNEYHLPQALNYKSPASGVGSLGKA